MVHSKKHLSRVGILILSLIVAACETPTDSGTPFSTASVGYLVIDQDSEKVLLQKNPDRLFIPASTVKVPTSVAALDILGPDYRFETSLFGTGNITDGTLDGDLYLKGGGDPLLSVQDLMGLVQHLRAQGVRRVAGSFFYDDSFLTSSSEITKSQPETAPYNPGISALSLDFNRIQPAPESYHGGTFTMPVKNPALRTATTFRRLAVMNGINLPVPIARQTPPEATQLAKHQSPVLYEVLGAGLEFSNNLVSELIGATAARTLMTNPAPLHTTSSILSKWLQSRIEKTDWTGYRVPNHSGLSAKARMSPQQMVDVLRYADSRQYAGKFYRPLLPASGRRGSFRQRLHTPDVDARVWAKTGTMNYAKGLAGYLYTKTGKRFIFALFITDFELREKYDSSLGRHATKQQQAVAAWIAKAEDLEETLIRKWIDQF